MPEVEDKFLRNRLSISELEALRNELNGLSDADLSVRMADAWSRENFPFAQLPTKQVQRMKRKIDAQTYSKHRVSAWQRWVQIAAAILLPIFIGSTVYLYHKNEQLVEQRVVVSTSCNEKANVTLPDGTTVMLNSESRLTYAPKDFSSNRRYVTFEGEAYFDVQRRAESSFLVASDDVRVEVLGTQFNLLARSEYDSVELFLEEGSVRISSSKDAEILAPNQKAVLSKSTGQIQVLTLNKAAAPAWRSGELRLSNTPFSEVVRTLEMNFGVDIEYSAMQSLEQDKFSGVLSSKHLIDALDVIGQCYRLNYKIVGDVVTLSK